MKAQAEATAPLRAWTRRAWMSLAGFGGFLILGSLGSFVAAIAGLLLGLRAVEAAPPESKAQQLAEAISASMNGAAFGVVTGILGAMLLGISLVGLFRKGREKG